MWTFIYDINVAVFACCVNQPSVAGDGKLSTSQIAVQRQASGAGAAGVTQIGSHQLIVKASGSAASIKPGHWHLLLNSSK